VLLCVCVRAFQKQKETHTNSKLPPHMYTHIHTHIQTHTQTVYVSVYVCGSGVAAFCRGTAFLPVAEFVGMRPITFRINTL
jgi:hypothetical protein